MEKLLRCSCVLLLVFSFYACKQTPSVVSQQAASDSRVSDSKVSEVVDFAEAKQKSIDDFMSRESSTNSNAYNDYNHTLWSEVIENENGGATILDIRYASNNNFTKEKIYDCARCFLRPEVKKQLLGFRQHIKNKYKLGIILYDCYRPRPSQQKLWDMVPDEKYVTNPAKGSMHNRGMAIDIGLTELNGNLLDMGTAFDHFGPESFHSATSISEEAIKNRKLLKTEMALYGFKSITSEWWHYSYRKNIQELSDWVWPCE